MYWLLGVVRLERGGKDKRAQGSKSDMPHGAINHVKLRRERKLIVIGYKTNKPDYKHAKAWKDMHSYPVWLESLIRMGASQRAHSPHILPSKSTRNDLVCSCNLAFIPCTFMAGFRLQDHASGRRHRRLRKKLYKQARLNPSPGPSRFSC